MTLASVNYRLSPSIKHPGHQEDVTAALQYMKDRYGMEEFVLVGHSAGACLAFQCASVPGCRAVVGVEGIYDLPELVEEYPKYRDFVEEAFGEDNVVWRKASPTNIILDVSTPLTVQLVQSTQDKLLSRRQTELMFSALQSKGNITLQDIAWIKGSHNLSIATSEFCTVIHNFIANIIKPNT